MARTEPQALDLLRWPGLNPSLVKHRPRSRSQSAAAALQHLAPLHNLRIEFEDASACGDANHRARLVVHSDELFLQRLEYRGIAGLGESYMAGEWSTPDLCSVLRSAIPLVATAPDFADPAETRTRKRSRRIARGGSKDTQESMPADLIMLYTDETMTESSAIFASGARTRTMSSSGAHKIHVAAPTPLPHRMDLGDAQRRAADVALDLAGVGQESRVLVPFAQWGEVALRAAERGARVRALTTDTTQLTMLGNRFAAAGHDRAIQLSLLEPESVTGDFDAVVALEPPPTARSSGAERVFTLAQHHLEVGGRVVVQTHTLGSRLRHCVNEVAHWQDCYLPSNYAAGSALDPVTLAEWELRGRNIGVAESAVPVINGVVDLSEHAAETYRLWRENLRVRGRDAAAFGFDSVYRRQWYFHLAAQEALLRERALGVVQLLATKN